MSSGKVKPLIRLWRQRLASRRSCDDINVCFSGGKS